MQPTLPAPPAAPVPPLPPSQEQMAALQAQLQAQLDAAVRAGRAAQGARAAPRTAQDVQGLREQRRELSNQLTSAQNRRRDVARALEQADNPANRAGLEQRLGVLDARIAQLESDMAETGRLITSASPALVAQADTRDRSFGDRGPPRSAVAIVFIVFVLFPLVLALTRGLRRRGVVTRPDPLAREGVERLARLEQAVDAIAVEVERVSEGQRFVTRLLAETRAAPGLARPEDTLDPAPRPYGQG